MDLQWEQSKNTEESLIGDSPEKGRLSQPNGKTLTVVDEIGTDFTFKHKIVWPNAIVYVIFHIMGLHGVFLLLTLQAHPLTVIYTFLMYVISGLGITMGAHRLYCHRAYKANTTLWRVLFIMFSTSGQNSLWEWVRDHRQHHRYSDTDADPHNARRGFFFSHVGWLLSRKHPKVLQYGKNIDMSDLEADPWVMFQKKYFLASHFFVCFLIPFFFPIVLWNEDPATSAFITYFARVTVGYNSTWCVNSVAHMFGTRPYDSNILPTQNLLVSLADFGEGWHNYHHTFPWDYRTSEFGATYNLSATLIDFCAKKGWAYDLRFPSKKVIEERIKRTGDHPTAQMGSVYKS